MVFLYFFLALKLWTTKTMVTTRNAAPSPIMYAYDPISIGAVLGSGELDDFERVKFVGDVDENEESVIFFAFVAFVAFVESHLTAEKGRKEKEKKESSKRNKEFIFFEKFGNVFKIKIEIKIKKNKKKS